MRLRITTLNLNHRTHPIPIPSALIEAIGELDSNMLVLTEYVEGKDRDKLYQALSANGLPHIAVSKTSNYAKGRWNNQVLVSSFQEIEQLEIISSAPDLDGDTNILIVNTSDIKLCGLRVPAYTVAVDWYGYWEWLNVNVKADIVIGDLNVDPARNNKRDRVLNKFQKAGDWTRPEIEGKWSYKGINGSKACLDHALVTKNISVKKARYVADPFVPNYTDHAALVIDIEVSRGLKK